MLTPALPTAFITWYREHSTSHLVARYARRLASNDCETPTSWGFSQRSASHTGPASLLHTCYFLDMRPPCDNVSHTSIDLTTASPGRCSNPNERHAWQRPSVRCINFLFSGAAATHHMCDALVQRKCAIERSDSKCEDRAVRSEPTGDSYQPKHSSPTTSRKGLHDIQPHGHPAVRGVSKRLCILTHTTLDAHTPLTPF